MDMANPINPYSAFPKWFISVGTEIKPYIALTILSTMLQNTPSAILFELPIVAWNSTFSRGSSQIFDGLNCEERLFA